MNMHACMHAAVPVLGTTSARNSKVMRPTSWPPTSISKNTLGLAFRTAAVREKALEGPMKAVVTEREIRVFTNIVMAVVEVTVFMNEWINQSADGSDGWRWWWRRVPKRSFEDCVVPTVLASPSDFQTRPVYQRYRSMTVVSINTLT